MYNISIYLSIYLSVSLSLSLPLSIHIYIYIYSIPSSDPRIAACLIRAAHLRGRRKLSQALA